MKFIFAFLLIFFVTASFGKSILETSADHYFEQTDDRKIGLEVEFSGLSTLVVSEVVKKYFPGEVDVQESPLPGQMKYKIRNKDIGKIAVVPELNGAGFLVDSSRSDTLEIVFPPITVRFLNQVQQLLTELKSLGATGTSPGNPVSIQINTEMGEGLRGKISVSELLNILRNYFLEPNRSEITRHLSVPEERQVFLGELTPGLTQKLKNPDYSPDWGSFYIDYFYRQALELSGDGHAWEYSERVARQKAIRVLEPLSMTDPLVMRLRKLNALRVSSLLAFMVPDEWFSQRLEESSAFKANPILEFREANNDFDIVGPVEEVLGFLRFSEMHGAVNHFDWSAEQAGISKEDTEALKAGADKSVKDQRAHVVRILYEDPSNERFLKFFNHSTPVNIRANSHPLQPLMVPGESVVFHRMATDQNVIMGKYNPVLHNVYIAQILNNKYVEARFFRQYAPNAFPETLLLSEVLSDDVDEIRKTLDSRFPGGWVLKGNFDNATQKSMLITESTEIQDFIRKFKDSDFRQYIREVQEKNKGASPDAIVRELKRRPDEFMGWRLHKMMKAPHTAIVQEKIPDIAREFRVEVIAGEVLEGATVLRYQQDASGNWLNVDIDPSVIKQVENFVRDTLARFPEELRAMTFGMDVALTKSGDLKIIESNPLGNSGFLVHSKTGIRALDKYLRDVYVPNAQKGREPISLGVEQQMQYIDEFLGSLELDREQFYPHLIFKPDGIDSKHSRPVGVRAERACLELIDGKGN